MVFSVVVLVGCDDNGGNGPTGGGDNGGTTGGNLVLGANQAWVECDIRSIVGDDIADGVNDEYGDFGDGFGLDLDIDDVCVGVIFRPNGEVVSAVTINDPVFPGLLELAAMIFEVDYTNENWAGVVAGTWKVNGNQLTITDPDGDAETVNFKVTGGNSLEIYDDYESVVLTRQNNVRVLILPIEDLDDVDIPMLKAPESAKSVKIPLALLKQVSNKMLQGGKN